MRASASESQLAKETSSALPASLARYSLTQNPYQRSLSRQDLPDEQAPPAAAAMGAAPQVGPQSAISTHVGRRMRVTHDEWRRLTKTQSQLELPTVGAAESHHTSSLLQDDEPSSPVSPAPRPPPSSPSRHGGQQYSYCSGRSTRARSIFGLPVLHPHSRGAVLWSTLMLLVDATYTAFVVPAGTAFCDIHSSETGHSWCSIMELTAGTLFLANLIVNFHIGYTIVWQYKHYTLLNGRKVAVNYIRRGGFWMDVVSVVPTFIQIALLTTPERSHPIVLALRLLLLVRLIRLSRLLRMMYLMSLTNRLHPVMHDVVSVFGLYVLLLGYCAALTINFFACALYLVADLQGLPNSWIMRYQSSFGDLQPHINLLTANHSRRYLMCIYWVTTTMTTVGFGDLTPTTVPETLLIMCVQLVGALLFAVLVGGVSEALGQATTGMRQAQQLRLKLSKASQWGRSRDLPRSLRAKIYAYYSYPWLERQEDPDELEVVGELPHALRAQVAQHLMADTVQHLPLFAGLDDWSRNQVTEHLLPSHLAPDEEACREGMVAGCLWVLQEGEVRVVRFGRVVDTLRGPCVLGDACILGGDIPECRFRPCTLAAVTHCQVWRLALHDLQPLLATSRKAYHCLLSNMRDALINTLAAAQTPSTSAPRAPSPPIASTWTELLLYLSALSTPHDALQLLTSFRSSAASDGTLISAIQKLVHDSCAAASNAYRPIWSPAGAPYQHTAVSSQHSWGTATPFPPSPIPSYQYPPSDAPRSPPIFPYPSATLHPAGSHHLHASFSSTPLQFFPLQQPPPIPGYPAASGQASPFAIPTHPGTKASPRPPGRAPSPKPNTQAADDTDQSRSATPSPCKSHASTPRTSQPSSPRHRSASPLHQPSPSLPAAPPMTLSPSDTKLTHDNSLPTPPPIRSRPPPRPTHPNPPRLTSEEDDALNALLPQHPSSEMPPTSAPLYQHPSRMPSEEDLTSGQSLLSIISSSRQLVIPPEQSGLFGSPRRCATAAEDAHAATTSPRGSITNRISSMPSQRRRSFMSAVPITQFLSGFGDGGSPGGAGSPPRRSSPRSTPSPNVVVQMQPRHSPRPPSNV